MVFLKVPRKYYIETFGCQMNVHDSEKMAGILSREGYAFADVPDDADVIIYNTCSIREKAEQKFFSELGRVKKLKKKKPHVKIAVAGCIAQQRSRGIFRRAPHVDIVLGPQNLHLLTSLISRTEQVIADHDNPEIALTDLPVLRGAGGRAWVTIMYGCDNFCSYCIVPFTRGRERSRPSDSIMKEIAGIADRGFKEVTLLGQNVNSYRSDVDFPGLLRRIENVRGIERVRFVTSHPRDLSDGLIDAMRDLDSVCEHIHLPLQSGSTRVLGMMNRAYSYEDYRTKVSRLREKVGGISITTDIIAGFPGETEEDHVRTRKALEEIRFDGIFAFKYSARPGTRAASMEQVAEETRSRRLKELLDVQDSITLELNKTYETTRQEILVEGVSEAEPRMMTGRTRSNKIVNFQGDASLTGTILSVRILEARRHSLLGSRS